MRVDVMLKALHVEKFRAMRDLHIPLGKKVTVIAGQNATCKSTLLGMLGQPFGLKNERTIFDKPFSTKFSDIFKFSKKYDLPRQHEYSIEFYDDTLFGKTTEYISSYKRPENDTSHIRLVVGKKREKGDGNLDYPVIYLGLKRVFPLGELSEAIEETTPTLDESEVVLFNKWYDKIFCTLEKISPIQITAKSNKDTLAVQTDSYDYFGNSAGQDNIGQILGAFLSFKRLKDKLGEKYNGGLVLIDELDATLFPAAQNKLISLFYKMCRDYDLQIVFTTHSLEAIGYILEHKQHNNGDTEIHYFTNVHGMLEHIHSPEMSRIRGDLMFEAIPPQKEHKINLYCEDAEAATFIKRLLGPKLTKYVNIVGETFGADFLLELAKKRLDEFNNSIIVLDGDKYNAIKKIRTSNVIVLPGNMNPENVFRTFLDSLPPNHPFWHNRLRYTKQVFKSNLDNEVHSQYGNRELMKKWFNKEKVNWGRGCTTLYNCWKQEHADEVALFREKFIHAYNSIAKRISIPSIQDCQDQS